MNIGVVLFMCVLSFPNGIYSKYYSQHTRRNETPKDLQSNTIEYYTSSRLPKITIPIMIHLDKVLTRKLSQSYKKTVKHYFRDILDSLEVLFMHPSLNQTVSFNLLDVKMLKNASRRFQMDKNVSKYLKSYCQWQGEKKTVKKKWYYSVLFTGLDLHYFDARKNKIKSTGRGYMRGICSVRHSCTLLAWRPHNLAYIMAHEIAHSLGMSHDGPPYNQCRGPRNIMLPTFNPRASSWSSCNKQALEKFMLSSKSWCLHSYARNSLFYVNESMSKLTGFVR